MENDFPKIIITIYHQCDNQWQIYHVLASFRNTSILNRNNTGIDTADSALIRIFDEDNINVKYEVDKKDVIVNKEVDDKISSVPITELQKKYGKNNVFQVKSIDKFKFGTELDHIKVGAI